MDNLSDADPISAGKLLHCELDGTPIHKAWNVGCPVKLASEVFFVMGKTFGFSDIL